MNNRLTQWFQRHIVITMLSIFAVCLIAATLIWWSGAWFWSGGRETFGALSAYVFNWIAFAIASVAAAGSVFAFAATRDSHTLTRESLELTRATNRPFVSCTGAITKHSQGNNVVLSFPIHNSGSLPADDAYVEIAPFHTSEHVAEHNQSNVYTRPSRKRQTATIFPEVEHEELLRLDLTVPSDKQLWQDIQGGVAQLRVRITYKRMGLECVTIQTMGVLRVAGRGVMVVPKPPQKWK